MASDRTGGALAARRAQSERVRRNPDTPCSREPCTAVLDSTSIVLAGSDAEGSSRRAPRAACDAILIDVYRNITLYRVPYLPYYFLIDIEIPMPNAQRPETRRPARRAGAARGGASEPASTIEVESSTAVHGSREHGVSGLPRGVTPFTRSDCARRAPGPRRPAARRPVAVRGPLGGLARVCAALRGESGSRRRRGRWRAGRRVAASPAAEIGRQRRRRRRPSHLLPPRWLLRHEGERRGRGQEQVGRRRWARAEAEEVAHRPLGED
jgi:hypothetical protein